MGALATEKGSLSFSNMGAVWLQNGKLLTITVEYEGKRYEHVLRPVGGRSEYHLLNYALLAMAKVPGLDVTLGALDALKPRIRARFDETAGTLDITISDQAN